MSGGARHGARPSSPPHFHGLGQPEPSPQPHPAGTVCRPWSPPSPHVLTPPASPFDDPQRRCPLCPLSLTLALVSGLPICLVGFLAWGIPFLNLTAAIDPLSHSIRTLVFAILERDLTLTWANMRALAMAQRRRWDVQGQPVDAFAEAESLAQIMWPLLESNPQLLSVMVLTLAGNSAVRFVATHTSDPNFGACVDLQNGTNRWLEGWNFQNHTFAGRVLQTSVVLGVAETFNGFPINTTTPAQPFSWIPVYNPQANLGNIFSADVGLFDALGRYIGRYSITMSTAHLARFLVDQLASQPATRGGRLALCDELGLVVAASHGTADQSRRYALTEIGDPDLEAVGRLLRSLPGGWCPTGTSLDVRFSVQYFLDVQLFADSVTQPTPLMWCGVLLSPRANIMSAVDQSVAFAAPFVCGTTLGVTALAVALGLLVTRPIQRLTAGMGALKAGRVAEARRATGRRSVFAELFVAQGSYDSLVEAIDAFGKYVPATVVRGLLAGTIRPKLGMTEKDVVVAFMDVEDFTRMCEINPVEDIVSVTCQLFDTCCDIILSSQGTVDKFIGDCVMAMWGAPAPLLNPSVNAVEALIEILVGAAPPPPPRTTTAPGCPIQCGGHGYARPPPRPELRMLRRQPLACDDGAPVGLLVGAHGGRCLVGNFGATARWDYTAVGDVVNAAARLGPLNKQFGTHCLVSGAVHDQAAGSAWATSCMRPMGDAVVVGKRKALAVYEVREQPVADRDAWALAVQLFGAGDLDQAAEYFRALPDDVAAQAFLEDVERSPRSGPYHRTMRSK